MTDQSPPPPGLDRLPPHSPEAEQGALGCCLLSPVQCIPETLAKLGRNGDAFYDLRHRTIYKHILALHDQGVPVDVIVLQQALKDNRVLEEVGGIAYLAALPDTVPSSANLSYYLDIIAEKHQLRRVVQVCTEVVSRVYDYSGEVPALLEGIERDLLNVTSEATQSRSVIQLLDERSFNPNIEPPPLRPIYTLAGIPVSTPANLTTITSAIKTGKSAVLAAMAGAAMPHVKDADLLGFSSSNPKGMALLWFDSEQSPDDFWHCVNRAVKRAGLSKPPPWLLAYCLTGLGHKRAWECVQGATKAGAEQHGGIHSTLIDGLVDLIADVNDPVECNDFVAELHVMSIQRDCPIVGVIHFNPGGEKSRGHLGSQVERKAETNLALEKDADETTVSYSTQNRRAAIPKSHGPRFRFSAEAGIHVSIESRLSSKEQAQREALLCLAKDVFADHPAMRYTDIKSTVMTVVPCKERQAEKKVAEMKRLTVIKQSVSGLYVIATPA